MASALRAGVALIFAATVLTYLKPASASSAPISLIRLTRHGCEVALCPDYVLTLRKDGCDSLLGISNFALTGSFSSLVSRFSDAVEAINSHHFFQLKSAYPLGAAAPDAPVADLEVIRSSGPPTMVKITGEKGVPPSIVELFHIIDGIGLTDYWIDNNTKAPVSRVNSGPTALIMPANFVPCP